MLSLFWNSNKKEKEYTLYEAQRLMMRERNYFASMMVKNGDADAMLSGYSRNYSISNQTRILDDCWKK